MIAHATIISRLLPLIEAENPDTNLIDAHLSTFLNPTLEPILNDPPARVRDTARPGMTFAPTSITSKPMDLTLIVKIIGLFPDMYVSKVALGHKMVGAGYVVEMYYVYLGPYLKAEGQSPNFALAHAIAFIRAMAAKLNV